MNYETLATSHELQQFRHVVDEAFGFFPAQAGVGDGFAICAFTDLLIAVFDIAFNHQAFDQLLDVSLMFAAVDDVLGDTDLF